MNRFLRYVFGFFAALLLGLPGASAADHPAPLSLQDCLELAIQQNLQNQINYWNLEASYAQFESAQAPFALRMDATFDVPRYSEFRDTQESIALQTRIREESSDLTYNGTVTMTQSLAHIGQLSVVSSAQRRDFNSNFRQDFLDVYGDVRVLYSHDLLHTPPEEIALRRAELNLTNARNNYDRQQMQIEGLVTDAYYNLVYSIRQLEIEQQRLEQSRANLDLAQRQFEIGLIAEVEALRLRVTMLRDQATYIQAETQIERNRDLLREVLGMGMDAPIEVITEVSFQPYQIDPVRAIETALRQRTDMQQAEIAAELGRLNLKSTQQQNSATATFNANLGLRGRGTEVNEIGSNLERNQWGVGIRVNIPLIDNGQRRGAIRQAEAALEQQQLQRDIRYREIVRQIKESIHSLREAERQISIRQAALEIAERTYEIEQNRFEVGLTQSYQLLNAQTDLTQARISALGAVINYQRQLKNVRLATMAELDEIVVSDSP